ncbi:MAG: hypothetical protein PUP91_37510 [Rhizonema sp. PD37]|nr:hypothetical protein [Rhizonema sp. PD37]
MHRSDENFVAKATPILRLYAQAGFLLKAGFWVVCVDEKTSIQARERVHPSQAATPEQPVHEDPVTSGKVRCTYLLL